MVIYFIVYKLDSRPQNIDTDFILDGSLFGGVKLTKNVDPDKYSYNGYGIGLDIRGECFLTGGSVGENVIIFGVDMSSVYIDNRGKDI